MTHLQRKAQEMSDPMAVNIPSGKSTSLDRRLSVAIIGTVMIAIFLSLGLNLVLELHGRRSAEVEQARGLGQLIAESCGAPMDFMDVEAAWETLAPLGVTPNIKQATLFTTNGEVFAAFGAPLPMPEETQPDAEALGFSTFRVVQPVISRGENVGLLVLQGTFFRQQQWILRSLGTTSLIFLLVLGFSVAATRYFRRRITTPICDLTRVASDITRTKDYSRRILYTSDDEVGQLMREFNAMLHEVEDRDRTLNDQRDALEIIVANRTRQLRFKQKELERNNDRLVREAEERRKAEMIRDEVERINRHDLKSSLNLVIGYPELLLKRDGLEDEQRMYLKRIESAGYRMLDMIQNHLDMFKMEQGIYALRCHEVDMIELLCSLEEEMALLLTRQEVSISMTLGGQPISGFETLYLSGDMTLLRTLFRNLLVNAAEASTPGSQVEVSLAHDALKGTVTVSVHNNQPVPEAIRHRFFDKYVSHGKEDGTGLGTYSAKLIARTHNADISMETDDATGTSVTVVLPINAESGSLPECEA